MIVVGILVPGAPGADSVVEIARRAAPTGARTEVVGVAPPDAEGDRLLLELAGAGVGHATVTRSVARGIETADLDLALRYLPDLRAIALVQPTAALLATALAASSWSGATMIVVGPLDADAAALLDPANPASDAGAAARPGSGPAAATPILLDPPASDPDGAFAGVVAALAVRLDAGEDPAAAWQATVAALAIDPV